MNNQALANILFSVQTTESEKNREYWATRPWISPDLASLVRSLDVFVLPWEDFREGQPILFPPGTGPLASDLRTKLSSSVLPLVTAAQCQAEEAR